MTAVANVPSGHIPHAYTGSVLTVVDDKKAGKKEGQKYGFMIRSVQGLCLVPSLPAALCSSALSYPPLISQRWCIYERARRCSHGCNLACGVRCVHVWPMEQATLCERRSISVLGLLFRLLWCVLMA